MTDAAAGDCGLGGARVIVSDGLVDLFPRASASTKAPLDYWAEGSVLVEHGDRIALEERISTRCPTPKALAELDPDMIVSVYGFRDVSSRAGSAAAEQQHVQDLHTFPSRPVHEAVRLYNEGHTIVCWRMLEHLPEAQQRATDILRAVGMPTAPISSRGLPEPWDSAWPFVVSMVFSPGGQMSGLGLHYDRFDSVVVQLRGAKRWRVGRHPYLAHPIYSEESGAQLDFPPSLTRLAVRSDLVTELEDIEMRPGSALLLPRGVYHTTLADAEPSVSVGYHFALPTWSHLLVGALQLRLSRDPRMRTTPFGAFLPDGPADETRDAMRWAVGRLQEALRDPVGLLDDLLGDVASHHQAVFRLPRTGSACLVADDPPMITNYGDLGVKVPLPRESGPLCRWLLTTSPQVFDFEDALAAAARTMSPRAVWDLLQEAVEAGLLERRWGRRESGAARAGA